MPEGDIPPFAEATIRNAATCANLWGFTWWCSRDLNPGLSGFAPLEYDLGLLDHRNRVKPVGKKVAQIAGELANAPPTPAERSVALVLSDDDVFMREGHNPGWHFGPPYMALIAQGVRPSVVLASKASDSAYLAARGIKELREAR